MGAAIGLFSASVSPNITGPDAKQQSAREVFRDLKFSTLSYAKNFATVGLLFASVECTIESVSDCVIIKFSSNNYYYDSSIEGKVIGRMVLSLVE